MNGALSRVVILLFVLTVALPTAQFNIARAAGNAHIVDDADVETPGTCHVELWSSTSLNGEGYANAAPACTLESLPFVELGAAYQHYWGQSFAGPVFGPQIKVRFSAPEAAVGLGVGLNSSVNLNTGDYEAGSIIGLMSIPIDKRVNFHVNAGWSFLKYVERQNAFFYGAQFEIKAIGDVLLMVETFGRLSSSAGAQFGLRYTPNDGPLDFDLMVGSYFDQVNPQFITFGLTVRF
jgi:hypothetical protein